MYGTGRGRGGLIREGAGPITAEITVRAGQGGRQAGATAHGARQAREGGGGKTWGPLVGYVQPYQEAYVWDGAN